MFEISSRPPYRKSSILFIAALWAFGCASSPVRVNTLAPILPTSESRLETAPPAARDALNEGLRWIAADAPETAVEKPPTVHLARGDGP